MIKLDLFNKRVEQHITGVREATNRTRNIFLFINVTTLIILIALFNTTYTWQRHVNAKERNYRKYEVETVKIDSGTLSDNELRRHYTNMYFDRQFLTIPLLGIRVSSSDLSILAPMALLIFVTWYFYALRRENHIVIKIYEDFKKIKRKIDAQVLSDKETIDEWKLLLNMLYTGCMHQFVLNIPTTKDYKKKNSDDFLQNLIARPIIKTLHWIPIITLVLLFLSDVSEYTFKQYMKLHNLEMIVIDLILLSLTGVVTYQIYIIRQITTDTRRILSEMATDGVSQMETYDL